MDAYGVNSINHYGSIELILHINNINSIDQYPVNLIDSLSTLVNVTGNV